jgi:hypothetical protein
MLAIRCVDPHALLDPIQSVAKHATESLDGNRRVLSDRVRGTDIAHDRFRIRMLH